MEQPETSPQPLTSAQRGMWMAEMIAAKGSTYIIAESVELKGSINEKLFIRALLQVAQEAEVLRSRFVETEEGPVQEILPNIRGVFPVFDVSEASDPRGTAEDWMNEKIRTPVNFKNDQLWLNALFKIDDENYLWFHGGHHVIFDGYSASLIVARVAELYTSMIEGIEPSPCTFLPSYNLKEQEDAYRNSPQYQKDENYWKEYLDDCPDAISMSLHPSRPPNGESGGFINRTLNFSEERTNRLAEIAKENGATMPQAMVALVAAYFMRVTGVKDFVMGMPISGRGNKIMRQTPGMVANASLLRFKQDENTTFKDFLDQSRRAMRGALRHQQYRYEDLRKLFGKFDNSQQVARLGVNIEPFNYQLTFGEAKAVNNQNLSNGAMQDLTVFGFHRQDGNGFVFKFDANPALYTRIELLRHINLMNRLATLIMASPNLPLEKHDLYGDDDIAEAKGKFRSVKREWPRHHLKDMMLTSFTVYKEPRKLITDKDGDYFSDEFERDVKELSEVLVSHGVKAGQLVGVGLPRDRRMIVAIFAIAATGAAWLPLDIYGPRDRLQIILDDARPSVVLADNSDEDGLLDIVTDKLLCLKREPHFALSSTLYTPEKIPSEPLPDRVVPDGTAYVTYTSGTTGKPKGVIIPHTALANFLYSMVELIPFSAKTRLLAVTTITFDISTLEQILPVLVGGSIVIATKEEVLDPIGLTAMVFNEDVNTIQATPTLWQSLFAIKDGEAFANKVLLTGGEALTGHLATRMVNQTDTAFNVYGPTETTIWSTCRQLTADDKNEPAVGYALANTDILIIDEFKRLVPDGIIGELAIGGTGVATGYLNRPELTADRFIPTPSILGEGRIYRTGDLAVRDTSGILHVIGRTDDQVKIRGMRIEPGEVESAIIALPEVAQAAVVVEKDPEGGNAELASYLIPADSEKGIDLSAVRHSLRTRLTSQMVPTKMAVLDSLPRMPSGKLDRRALKNIKIDDVVKEIDSGEFIAPRSEGEELLAEIWRDVLNLREIDVTANFFDLGGDSIKVLQFISELHRRGHDIPIGQVFTVPTIEALAPWFEEGAATSDPLADVLTLRTGDDDKPPVFCIHPVAGVSWAFASLADHIPEGRSVYALQHARPVIDETPYSSFHLLAEHYLVEMRRLQPEGPYNIVGWSMGGLLGYEIAKKLREQGEQIESLTILDAYPYKAGAEKLSGQGTTSIKAAMDFLAIKHAEESPLPSSLEDLASVILDEALSAVPEGLRPSEQVVDQLSSGLKKIVLYNMELVRQFHAEDPLKNDIIFIRANKRLGSTSNSVIDDSSDVWSGMVEGDVEFHGIDCRHQDMLHPANAAVIGKILQEKLHHADSTHRVVQ